MYLRLLIFLLEILIPDCDSSSPSILHDVLYSKQGDNITALLYSFPNFELVRCHSSSSNCCFLTHPATSFFLELLVIALYSVAYCLHFELGTHLPVLYLFAFSYSSQGSCGQNTRMGSISSFRGPCFVRTLHNDLSILGGSAQHGSLLR